ncbi:single-stranded DNA-binding protein [Mucilaginibacter rubeus]|uniref:Single-stranded DNA-binding protein n=1 Tax=Mucilaginibacter rubeus TaxID=2027860 RepID=A0AAE6MGG6_9SPHI|nr:MULTISPECIES: single-stranded DNA-binding protein [Mucilaginibacter]QEM02122.1 single-stranded DNA-binding protein [Mucilaginibacter rubeus]QEM14750.1 single-stranded DNA-binding protein [Mucilaginibacter gossypii]QTE42543.1 single-stranded DNA-binding protein [Mucilaginibacter rubeus]QTE49144.1 single-stranded DNA-binding protein [Mucilaginibacter rubeus]QTE54242.1 single-stranded DNA-binding protein [Mucilaginibacter rubeus]
MNSLRNSVRLVGNLGMDPEVKVFDSNKKMVRLSIATNESYKNDKGEKITDTQWHNLIFWGTQAKLAEDLLKKGDEVAVEGKLANRNYTDKDGIKRYVSEVIVNEFLKVGVKG